MTTKNMKVQLRRDTASNWTTKNPVLLSGEMGIESDTNKFKFGDGNKTWTQLDYASSEGGSGDIEAGYGINITTSGSTKTINADAVSDIAVEQESHTEVTEVINTSYNADTPNTGFNPNASGYWFTNYNNFYTELVGHKITSLTFYVNTVGIITFWGYNGLNSPETTISAADSNTYATEALQNSERMITINATATGKQTFKLDGTDDRVTINNQEMCNSFPKMFGWSRSGIDTGKAYYNVQWQTDLDLVKFIYSNTPYQQKKGKLWIEIGYESEETVITNETFVKYNNGTKKKISDAISVDLGADAVTFDDKETLQYKYDTGELGVENKLKGKRLSWIGDSISTFQGYMPSGYAVWYPHGSVQDVEQVWWKKLLNMSGMVLGQNCAWSGSKVTGDSTSTSSAAAGCSTRRISDLALNGTPDIIICYIGINDLRNGIGLGSWTKDSAIPAEGTISTISEAYALMVYKVMNTYKNATVFCCSCLDTTNTNSGDATNYPVTNANGMSLPQLNEKVREVCWGLGAHYIDLHSCGITHWNVAQTMEDGRLHPNEAGHTMMANVIYGEIKKHFGN